ncbi:hypothetical protein BH10BAC5_BH10BAC5_24900 [soil metagenome]
MIDKIKIEISCPQCKFNFYIYLKEILFEYKIVCLGCFNSIQLIDENKNLNKSNNSIYKLIDGIKNLSNI